MNSRTSTPGQYLQTKVLTASPEQLQLMLYDGAIRFCEQARPALEGKQVEKSYTLLRKAEDILMALCTSMREDLAPETCANIKRLYMFCYERLVQANIKKDLEPLDDALKVLRHMRQTWVMLMEQLQQEKGRAEPPAPGEDASDSGEPAGEVRTVGAKINFEG